VAVVSISRIQVRRGQKNQGSGLPQLASGEFGWAVDTQELFIGNGSVAEGAPFVGNTKLLTEHDDLFQFADAYSYRQPDAFIQTGSSANNPVYRTLQDRLDDRVSVRAFGATGDGTVQTAELQRAIDQLYLNSANKGTLQARVELFIEPGEYVLSNPLYLPPYSTIRGAGREKTFIRTNGNFPAFVTVNDEFSSPGTYADDSATTTLNQPRNIEVSGLTVRTNGYPAFLLRSCKDSIFSDLWLQGSWNIGDPYDATNSGIQLISKSTAVTCSNNRFNGVRIRNFSYAVSSDYDIINNWWEKGEVFECFSGFVFGEFTTLGTVGQATGPAKNTISNTIFDDVMAAAIIIYAGPNNTSINNKFYNVGNSGGTPDNNAFPNIQFDDQGCASINDYFQRAEFLGYDATYLVNVPYTNEVVGSTITEYKHPHTIAITEFGSLTKLFKLPAKDLGRGYLIDYLYRSNQVNAVRSGTISLVVDPVNDTYNLTDEYDYTGDGTFQENLEFTAQNYDENGDGVVDTVAIMVLNSTSSDTATFTYTIKYKS
jgi:hypothetical protein